ncbi:hypothetical protein TSUD_398540 [Trifolium subterraneum]|uniref:TF-B3 domain-containing protein n=1 Tax=Trifolium subterraneum TaxID=3900 RepID=A0A2Z6PD71_TRISU|nr:hypothetical protein TSUD_398540 [Trifolium subterraneum]
MAFNNPFLMHDAAFLNTEAANRTDKEHDSYIDDFFTAMRTYRMEFDAENPIGKLPACFSREYLNTVDSFVMLRDSNLNEFEVHVTKKSNKLYFDTGWSDLKNVDPKFFTIRITTRLCLGVILVNMYLPLAVLIWFWWTVLVSVINQCKVTIGVDVEGQYTGLTCALFMEWLREQGLDFVLPSLPVIMSCMLLLTLKWGFRQN